MAASHERLVTEVQSTADEALFERSADALVLTTVRNERPLCGLAGRMDWRFGGLISQALRQGAITGAEGEFAYIPVAPHGRRMHLFLLGMGNSESPGARSKPPTPLWAQLSRACKSLKVSQAVVSQADLGGVSVDEVQKQMKGVTTWVIP